MLAPAPKNDRNLEYQVLINIRLLIVFLFVLLVLAIAGGIWNAADERRHSTPPVDVRQEGFEDHAR